jgi:hypothetical protein
LPYPSRLTLLWVSSGRRQEYVVELAGDVALQAANDLGLRLALAGAFLGIRPRPVVPAQPPDGQQIEGAVGVAVAAAI